MSMDLALLDGSAQAMLIRNREVTPLELVDAAIARIEQLNPQLNAVITPLFEKARAQAARGNIPNGPFRGVPFLLKDLVCASAGHLRIFSAPRDRERGRCGADEPGARRSEGADR